MNLKYSKMKNQLLLSHLKNDRKIASISDCPDELTINPVIKIAI